MHIRRFLYSQIFFTNIIGSLIIQNKSHICDQSKWKRPLQRIDSTSMFKESVSRKYSIVRLHDGSRNLLSIVKKYCEVGIRGMDRWQSLTWISCLIFLCQFFFKLIFLPKSKLSFSNKSDPNPEFRDWEISVNFHSKPAPVPPPTEWKIKNP